MRPKSKTPNPSPQTLRSKSDPNLPKNLKCLKNYPLKRNIPLENSQISNENPGKKEKKWLKIPMIQYPTLREAQFPKLETSKTPRVPEKIVLPNRPKSLNNAKNHDFQTKALIKKVLKGRLGGDETFMDSDQYGMLMQQKHEAWNRTEFNNAIIGIHDRPFNKENELRLIELKTTKIMKGRNIDELLLGPKKSENLRKFADFLKKYQKKKAVKRKILELNNFLAFDREEAKCFCNFLKIKGCLANIGALDPEVIKHELTRLSFS